MRLCTALTVAHKGNWHLLNYKPALPASSTGPLISNVGIKNIGLAGQADFTRRALVGKKNDEVAFLCIFIILGHVMAIVLINTCNPHKKSCQNTVNTCEAFKSGDGVKWCLLSQLQK